MVRVRAEKEKFGTKEALETLVRDWERKIWVQTAPQLPAAKQELFDEFFDDEGSKHEIVERVIQDREATQQVVAGAFDNEDSKQRIVERVSQDRDATQGIVAQAMHDDALMRGLMGDELFLLWKARQQAQPPTQLDPDKPPTSTTQVPPTHS